VFFIHIAYLIMDTSHLIDNSTKNHVYNVLQQCHTNRTSLYYYVLNIGVLILFLGITGLILYRCNKDKLSEEEKKQKAWKDQQYVLSKIKYFKEENKNISHTGITNLPFMNANP